MLVRELPFRERQIRELLDLEEQRDGINRDYAGYGWARVDEIWLEQPGLAPLKSVRDALVVASIDPPMDPPLSRVTLTPAAVEAARSVLVIATSTAKRDAVERALHGDDDPRAVPAHVLRKARTVRFVIDRAAAPSS